MKTQDIRRIAEKWAAITEKKKLDPVDKDELDGDHDDREDQDIDNDGDADTSDEYLHNRRKTVKKAMAKEDVDQLDELSQKKMMRYKDKASADLAKSEDDAEEAGSSRNADRARARGDKREKGMDRADRLMKKRGQDPDDWSKMESLQIGDMSVDQLKQFMQTEEFAQLDELSRNTLASYVKKATVDMHQQKTKEGDKKAEIAKRTERGANFKDPKRNAARADAAKASEKADKRATGIQTAAGKLAKESVDINEEKGVKVPAGQLTKYADKIGAKFDVNTNRYNKNGLTVGWVEKKAGGGAGSEEYYMSKKAHAAAAGMRESAAVVSPTTSIKNIARAFMEMNQPGYSGYPPQEYGDNLSPKDREFVDMHGGLKNEYDNPPQAYPNFDGEVAAAQTAEAISNSVGHAQMRHTDNTQRDYIEEPEDTTIVDPVQTAEDIQ